MPKMIEVTKAGGAYHEDEGDVKISVNAENINIYQPAIKDEVGRSTIIFNNGMKINVVETFDQLKRLIKQK